MSTKLFTALIISTAFAVGSTGCAGAGPKKDEATGMVEMIQVDVAVEGLSDDDANALEQELTKIDNVYNLRRDPLGSSVVYTFEYGGDFERLRRRIESIEYPGMRPQQVVASLQYEGFDNRGPVLDLISPNTEEVVTETSVEFVLEVKDSDVAEVTVNGTPAKEGKPGIYSATVELPEGEHEVELYAKDEAGNETKKTVDMNVDTTPPELEATVKVVVEGKVEPGSEVYVDGQKAEVNMFGAWRVELAVRRGQKTVEVVAIDKAGNKKTEQKPIGL